MQSNNETGISSLKLIKLFTSWQRGSSSQSTLAFSNQDSQILDPSSKSIPESINKGRKFGKINRTMSISYIYKKDDMSSIDHQNSVLNTSFQQRLEDRDRTCSQIMQKNDLQRQASKARLEGKVQEAERKLQEMKMGFKRLVQEKNLIVKQKQNMKPRIKISLTSH